MDGSVFLLLLAVAGYYAGHTHGMRSGRKHERQRRADIAASAMDYMTQANLPTSVVNRTFSYLLTEADPEIRASSARQTLSFDKAGE